MDVFQLISNLKGKDTKLGCSAMNLLLQESENSADVYQFFDELYSLTKEKNSYMRTRGLLLICANAKYDKQNKINAVIDDLLTHTTDEKPITSRQFIAALPKLAEYKPELKEKIIKALESSNTLQYPDSMRPLVEKDIVNAVNAIKSQK